MSEIVAALLTLVCVDPSHTVDLLVTLDWFYRIAAVVVETVLLILSASQLSQRPFRSREFTWKTPGMDPSALLKVHKANKELEAIAWCAEQVLRCDTR